MFAELSDTAILKTLGSRIKEYRISMGLKQADVAEESGVGLSTVNKIENGKSVSLQLFISVLRTLNVLDNLEMLIPEVKISPLQLLDLQKRNPKRLRVKN